MLPEPDMIDTNIFVHLLRADAVGQRIKAEFDLLMTEVKPGYCTVIQGELRALANKYDWGDAKVDQMLFLLNYFVPYSIETTATGDQSL